MTASAMHYTVLSGGVGGAKLVSGLAACLPPERLQVIANTGDDFTHFGLPVCPDLDTLMYTLAGSVNPATGWGLADETDDFMAAVRELAGPDWFMLGDRDMATHVRRRDLLVAGASLSEATATLYREAGVAVRVWPMSDAPAKTVVKTAAEALDFQDYFVRLRAEPVATGFRYGSATGAPASDAALAALEPDASAAILLTPSNPWLSIDPILSLSDIRTAIGDNPAPVVGVSPIVGGRAIKGPTAKLMAELGIEVSAAGVARHYAERYGDLLDGFIIDNRDADLRSAIEKLGIRTAVTNTIMQTIDDKRQLAAFACEFAAELAA